MACFPDPKELGILDRAPRRSRGRRDGGRQSDGFGDLLKGRFPRVEDGVQPPGGDAPTRRPSQHHGISRGFAAQLKHFATRA
jgi:hypothetical protein